MGRKTTRFTWDRNATDGTAIKTDTVTGETAEFSLAEYPEEIRAEMAIYGLTKIYDDRHSQIPLEGKMAELQVLTDQMMSGKWKADRVVGARVTPPIISVIMALKGVGVSAAQKAWRAQTDERKAELTEALADEIKAEIARREASDTPSLDDVSSN